VFGGKTQEKRVKVKEMVYGVLFKCLSKHRTIHNSGLCGQECGFCTYHVQSNTKLSEMYWSIGRLPRLSILRA